MSDLRNYGFLPGGYLCKCTETDCQTIDPATKRYGDFTGAKRSWRCENCAKKAHAAQLVAQRDPAKPRRIPQLVRDRMVPRPGFEEANISVPPALTTTLLVAKVHSEIEEVALDLTNPEEYADVLECLMTLAMLNGVNWKEVELARAEKHERKGGLQTGNLWIPEEFCGAAQ